MALETEQKPEQKTEAEPEIDTSSNLPKDFLEELEGAVTGVVETVERERASRKAKEKPAGTEEPEDDPEPKDLPPEKDPAGDGKGGEEPPKGDDKGKKAEKSEPTPDVVPDALVERAIKAGMSIADARSFQKADALERVIGVLEKKHGAEGGADRKPDGERGGEDDPLKDFPELSPDVYDEGLIKAVNALKDIVKTQHQTISELKKGGAAAQEASWFDGQVAKLGETFVSAVGNGDRSKLTTEQSAKLHELESKYKILAAGYKAEGKDVPKETVFNDAVALVLGDVQAKAKEAELAGQLANRERRRISRPSGQSFKAAEDPLKETAEAIDRKFFGKK